ncbi:MAG: hypothetical protein COS14_08035 [Bacteroidetes bacterium CG02_land_8_20_14_3_00_31_25]|nr:HEPN domain-containing protein [Bacteroidota bacterium]PIV58737.1 MAG: hypothetical protein COS14_08035 [Bacteroidetes bacterium CG02_land_8_20_14_3_00_31_25]PIX35535.1 MAG: hypothetical protein COZ59_05890 [Bacteroidetes bacterium CG_4_8_14_3_um_filter_31_14]PIY02993.1 MAG: hypothetical protein COZ21_11260 [Bacteroidetes bacterium CG_4_10_14_3_um_filter_31_20]
MNGKIETVKAWIEKGDHDLGTAQITYLHIPKYRDTIAFHCQQAGEKYLKSYLIFLEIPFKRTHDLIFILGLISQKNNVTKETYDKAAELKNFAVEIRYPDTIIDLSEQDIQKAILLAKEFREYVLSRMEITMDYDSI